MTTAVAERQVRPGGICVTGSHATARVYTQEILVNHNDKVLEIIGVYSDQLVKHDETWLFEERVYTISHGVAPE